MAAVGFDLSVSRRLHIQLGQEGRDALDYNVARLARNPHWPSLRLRLVDFDDTWQLKGPWARVASKTEGLQC